MRRIRSGRALIDELAKAGVASFECEVDPNDNEMEELLEVIRIIEEHLPTPWDFDQRPAALNLSGKIKFAVAVSKLLSALENRGIGLYASSSWINARYPRYDMDEGHRYTTSTQRFEKVLTLQVLLCRCLEEKTYRKAFTAWGLEVETPRKPVFDQDLDDDIPF